MTNYNNITDDVYKEEIQGACYMTNCNNHIPKKGCYVVPDDCKEHSFVKFRCHSSYKKPEPCPPKPRPPKPYPPRPRPPRPPGSPKSTEPTGPCRT